MSRVGRVRRLKRNRIVRTVSRGIRRVSRVRCGGNEKEVQISKY